VFSGNYCRYHQCCSEVEQHIFSLLSIRKPNCRNVSFRKQYK
jgi:hypothetical protein